MPKIHIIRLFIFWQFVALGVIFSSVDSPAHENSVAITGPEQRLVIKSSDCRWLEVHVPDTDVAFKPGIDSNGQAVVPADLEPQTDFGNTDDLTFIYTIRLDDRFAENPVHDPAYDPARAPVGEAPIGTVQIKDGNISFNGIPFTDPEKQALSAACRHQYKNGVRIK